MEKFIKSSVCLKTTPPLTEPFLQVPLPKRPWERVLYLTTAASVVTALKAIFSRHGIPSVFMSDNGPQYTSREMKYFANSYGFTHISSSPKSNGLAERTVRTVKTLLGNCTDAYMALMRHHYLGVDSVLPSC